MVKRKAGCSASGLRRAGRRAKTKGMNPRRALFALIALLSLAPPAAAAEPLVADLSKHLVAITTGFAGTDVLLFGAVEGDGDVVVVVRGPNHRETVRRKRNLLGIWMNSGAARIDNAPAFYQVSATRPLSEIAPAEVLERHHIGLDHLDLAIKAADGGAGADEYRRALLRLKRGAGLYGEEFQNIGFLGRRLFRTDMRFPANVPVGTYLVEVYLIDKGEVIDAQTTPLVISKVGLGADVYDFAHRRAIPYGIIAVLMAAFSGWLAAAAFRRA